MRTFASYIMRGHAAAILIAAAFTVLSLLAPPLMQISAAVIALVTLRNSAQYGLSVILGAGIAAGVFAWVLMSGLRPGMGVIIAVWAASWLPVWLAANVLRATRSISLALGTAAALGIAAVVFVNIVIGDTTAWWRAVLATAFQPVTSGEGAAISPGDIDAFLDALAGLMTGMIGGAIVIGVMTSLFIGRWWQAILYNPGGFRTEFQGLRIGRQFSIFAVVVTAVMMMGPEAAASMASDVVIVLMATYLFAGLALAHAAAAAKNASAAWLISLYGLLFVLPQLVIVLASAGFTDSWMDLRRYLRPGRKPTA
ncbi:MAG: hypothetical protein FD165_805 [Gammaproteobacteria bacterium]|nr:MAG: hypothetical protein FD165_805 [Gammaproteobacteria bacterium]TND07132.1 MAG: hypothetical protein FD120_300 [Gammaproteobacteria bacterium]